jgi:hypothetical protein
MTQGEIDFTAARAARDAALEQVETNNAEWVWRATAALKDLCISRESFTSEDLWLKCSQLLLAPPREPRAMGAVLSGGQERGWCEPTSEWRTGWRGASHGRPVRVWRSLLHV